MTRTQEYKPVSTDTVIQDLKKVIESLKYGTVAIKVHNGRITQVEITEKRRFDLSPEFEKGEGI